LRYAAVVPRHHDDLVREPGSARRQPAAARARQVDEIERAVATLLRSLGGRSTVAQVAERSGSDLPAASIVLLEHLEAVGVQRVSRIAEYQKIGVPALTPRIKDLEAAGVIRRDVDPVDARASLISLTDTGRATLARIRDARCGILAEALVDMDPEAMVTAADALTRIAAAVERSQAERPLIIGARSTKSASQAHATSRATSARVRSRSSAPAKER
jgi:DNA-binding MarR family transcriptional regulator